MNLMPEILQKLGVEVGERFYIENNKKDYHFEVFFNENYRLIDSDFGSLLISNYLVDLLKGDAKIIKKPWKPQNRERGYYVNPAGDIIQNAFFKNNGRDVALVVMGNCFETEEEAEAAKPEMLKKMKEAWGD